MTCLDCSKNIKGGFGVGDKAPFEKFRCYNCILRVHRCEMNLFTLKQINDSWELSLLELEGNRMTNIVQAVNSQPKLLAALKIAQDLLEDLECECERFPMAELTRECKKCEATRKIDEVCK